MMTSPTRALGACAALVAFASASPAEAFRPSKTHRNRNYGELYLGLGGSAGLSRDLVPSAGVLAALGGGFNFDPAVGLTIGGAVGGRRTVDGGTVHTAVGHIDVEAMLDLGQVEPYALFGVGVVYLGDQPFTRDEDGESPPTSFGVRVGAGVDFWTARGSDRGNFFVPILGIRAAYVPSIALGRAPIGINQEVMIDLQLKFHFNLDLGGGGSNCLNPVGF